MSKTFRKLDLKNHEIDSHAYACNSLTNFEYKTHYLATKKDVHLQKKLVKSHQVILIFSHNIGIGTTV